MVYGTDAMLPVEIDTPTWRRDTFSEEGIKIYIYSSNLLFRRQTVFSSYSFTSYDSII
jgi:hypothetical protein